MLGNAVFVRESLPSKSQHSRKAMQSFSPKVQKIGGYFSMEIDIPQKRGDQKSKLIANELV